VTLLAEALRQRGYEVLCTREPGGTKGAEDIRALLLHGEAWDAQTELLLFLAARFDHVQKIIRPALARGAWVICDRYQDSTTAYQGFARGLGREYVQGLYRQVFGTFQPDLTLILDIPPEEGLRRAKGRGQGDDRFEREALDFHTQLREGFVSIALHEPERCVMVDALGSAQQVHERMIAAMEARYGAA
jgi:dTMP kinase